jgi:hypothetical protein
VGSPACSEKPVGLKWNVGLVERKNHKSCGSSDRF